MIINTLEVKNRFNKDNIFPENKISGNVLSSNVLKQSNKPTTWDFSFTAEQARNNYVIDNAKQNKKFLTSEISRIMQKDRTLLADAFYGEISEDNKFSKAGWYYLRKQNDTHSTINQINPRKFIRSYNEFYQQELASVPDVAQGKKSYLDERKTRGIRNEYNTEGSIDAYMEREIDAHFWSLKENQETISQVNQQALTTAKNNLIQTLNSNPLLMKHRDLIRFMDITDRILDNVDNTTYSKIYAHLDSLSEALRVNNPQKMQNAFNSLTEQVIPQWEKFILKPDLSKQAKKEQLVNGFKTSKSYQFMNNSGRMDLIFALQYFSLDQKAFLVEKFTNDALNENPTTHNFLNFLKDTIVSDKKKKIILNRVMDYVQIAENNFPSMKEQFIQSVRDQDNSAVLFGKNLGEVTVLEAILEQLPNKDEYPLVRLNELTDEDLNKLLDNIKPSWIDEKYKEACENEEAKYDVADNFDTLFKKLTFELDGKEVNMNEFLEKSFEKLYGKTDALQENGEKILKELLFTKELTIESAKASALEYNAIMNQMLKIVNILHEQNKDSEKMYLELTKVIDKLEAVFPNNHKEIMYVRSDLERLRDGIFNKNNALPAALMISSGVKIGSSVAAAIASGTTIATGGLALPILFLLLYGGVLASNIGKEFDKPC